MPTPNLFSFATSELSQDAILAYMLSWADASYKGDPRHALGKSLIAAMASAGTKARTELKAGDTPLESLSALPDYTSVVVQRQLKKIDLVCWLDPTYGEGEHARRVVAAKGAILIEDKTFSSQHSDQLNRYLAEFGHGVDASHIYPIIYKTGLQASYKEEEKAGFVAFLRRDMVKVMLQHLEATQLDTSLAQYLDHLEKLTAAYERGHKKVPTAGMHDEFLAWNGFFHQLAESLEYDDLHWSYVPNQQGGFLGMWWCFKQMSAPELSANTQIYLQLDQDKLSIRAGRWGANVPSIKFIERKYLLTKCRHLLEPKFEELGYSLHRSGRSGRSCRLFRVLPKGANKAAKTFNAGQPISEVADSLKAITKAFDLRLG